jgi:hypothetical protein
MEDVGVKVKKFTLNLYNGIVKVHQRLGQQDGRREVNNEGNTQTASRC